MKRGINFRPDYSYGCVYTVDSTVELQQQQNTLE